MTHILFLMPYHGIEDLVEQAFARRSDKSQNSYQALVTEMNKIPDLHLGEDDVIISRGFTAAALNRTGAIVLELKITGYDVIMAINECLNAHPCGKIAFLGTPNMLQGADMINALYRNVDIVCYAIPSEDLLRATIVKAMADGCEAVVGGRSAAVMAKEMGIPAFMLRSGPETIAKAVDEAIRLAELRRSERIKTERMKTIMDYTFEGIICTDRQGVINMVNRYAMDALPQNHPDPIGRDIAVYLPELEVEKILRKRGQKVLSRIHKLGNRQISVNCVPFMIGREVSGAIVTFQEISHIQEAEQAVRKSMHKKGFVARHTFDHILGVDPATRETVRIAKRFSASDSNLLIFGETGVGKEIYAQSIHNASPRAGQPFVAINCASYPESLLESELFGYVDGAFTGAAKGGKMGLLELAHNGTLFLDEVGDISPALQARLLRVLQEREIIRLGGDRVIPIDVRIVSATNRDLNIEVERGRFRMDLLHRLVVLKLSIPPLRARPGDIVPLVECYLVHERTRTGSALRGIRADAWDVLLRHAWPGNVREVRNFCERLCVLRESEYATRNDVIAALEPTAGVGLSLEPAPPTLSSCGPEDSPERAALMRALECNRYNRKKTARALAISPATLWRKMRKYNIEL